MGQTEELIGEILEARPDLAKGLKIHSKAHPLVSKLDAEGIEKQIDASLKALKRSKLEVFYLHRPDSVRVPLLETLKACDKQYRAGKFDELGLSNYASWEVAYCHYLCLEHNLKAPTVYQGVMNAFNRTMEPELMPALRTLKMKAYVYNPLAGGLLTGRYHSVTEETTKGRFSAEYDVVPASMPDHPYRGRVYKLYRERYWNTQFFDAINSVRSVTDKLEVPLLDAALRWCLHHSTLQPSLGDGIIFGASNFSHVESNLKALQGGPLPEEIVKAFDAAVLNLKQESYFSGYDEENGKSFQYLQKFKV